MNRLLCSTYITGFSLLVEKHLKLSLKNVTVHQNLDGLIVYETPDIHHIPALRFINNSFSILTQCTHSNAEPLEKTIINLIRTKLYFSSAEIMPKKSRTFKVFVSHENQTISIARKVRRDIVDSITQTTGLTHSPLSADLEFWIHIRREGFAFFTLRIPKRAVPELAQGELRHELAHLLCLVSEPAKEDIVLDPFAGHGAIIKERTRFFPFTKAIASDIHTFDDLEIALKDTADILVKNYNALYLGKLGSNSVTKIITDPPWGMFNQKNKDYQDFYKKMLTEFSWIVAPNGSVVILTARKDEFLAALTEVKAFTLAEEYNILVSGKKAGVYKMIKKNTL